MSKFYTCVNTVGNEILMRGFDNGKGIMERIPYRPYIFEPSERGNENDSKFKTINNVSVTPKYFENIKSARNYISVNKDVANKSIFGLDKFQYMYIYDTYRGEIDYDPALPSVVTIDIEVDISVKSKYDPQYKIKVRSRVTMTEITIDLQDILKYEGYEVWDEEKKEWVEYSASCYYPIATGFPNIIKANNEVTLITISCRGKYSMFGCQPFENNNPNVTYYQCVDEHALLKSFLEIWNSVEYSADIVTGWNVDFFDMPYLINRIVNILGMKAAKTISPWKIIHERLIPIANKPDEFNQTWEIYGITVLDYMHLYKKFGYTIQESYSLDHIAFQVLGERKLDYGEYGSLAGLQTGSWQTYCLYNLRDVELVNKLDDTLKLIDLVMAMAYTSKVNFQDTFTTVNIWDIIIHNYLLDRNYVVHRLKVDRTGSTILGGYVKDPQIGQHKWVVSLDLSSLYPHIIMQYNISPETFRGTFPGAPVQLENGNDKAEPLVHLMFNGYVDAEKHSFLNDNNLTMTSNMRVFSRDKQGFLGALMQKIYNDRVVSKDEMQERKKAYELTKDSSILKDIARLNNIQMSKKILMNSGYGALANIYNRWYQREFAEAITSSGQLSTRWVERDINKYLNQMLNTTDVDYVIAADTDSVYIRLDTLVDSVFEDQTDTKKIIKFLDKVCDQRIQPIINKSFESLSKYINAFDQKMMMKRECIADKGIWTAKKRYMLNVWNLEGIAYDVPKLKMMGIEAIRTSTPAVCRSAIKTTIELIMSSTEDNMQKYIADFKIEFNKMSFLEIASPRSVSDIDKYIGQRTLYKKGTPINVKGAIVYNKLLEDLKLTNKYEKIVDKQKIKYSYLIEPNPVGCNVIASPGQLPPEFGLDRFINRDLQFEKSYLEPIKTIVGAIGWNIKKTITLEDLWS